MYIPVNIVNDFHALSLWDTSHDTEVTNSCWEQDFFNCSTHPVTFLKFLSLIQHHQYFFNAMDQRKSTQVFKALSGVNCWKYHIVLWQVTHSVGLFGDHCNVFLANSAFVDVSSNAFRISSTPCPSISLSISTTNDEFAKKMTQKLRQATWDEKSVQQHFIKENETWLKYFINESIFKVGRYLNLVLLLTPFNSER